MLEVIEEFLRDTGIKPETFGRLVLNDGDIFWKMKDGDQSLCDEDRERVLSFMHSYKEIKGWS